VGLVSSHPNRHNLQPSSLGEFIFLKHIPESVWNLFEGHVQAKHRSRQGLPENVGTGDVTVAWQKVRTVQ
jgi:hypothetical protein